MGREIALALLAEGARVAAIDLRQEGLSDLVQVADAGEKLSIHTADIADRTVVHDLPEKVKAVHGPVDILINNAGIIQPFQKVDQLEFDWIDRLIDVNFSGVVNMTKAFLPEMKSRPQAHIVNLSSMGGFIPFPGQTVYSATKAAVKVFSEGLYAELLDTNVGVSVVMPGAVATNITENSGVDVPDMGDNAKSAARALSADEAAKIILQGIENERLYILVGSDSKFLYRLYRLMPERAIRYIQRQMKGMLD